MQKIRAVIFNGQRNAGKTQAAEWIYSSFMHRIGHLKIHPVLAPFSGCLKRAAHTLFGREDLDALRLDEVKNEKSDIFHGRAPREIYDAMYLNILLPLCGKDALGVIFTDWIHNHIRLFLPHAEDVLIVTDCGMKEEAQVLADDLGAHNCLLIQIVSEEANNTESDYRNYFELDGVPTYRIKSNMEDLPAFRLEVQDVVREWCETGAVVSN